MDYGIITTIALATIGAIFGLGKYILLDAKKQFETQLQDVKNQFGTQLKEYKDYTQAKYDSIEARLDIGGKQFTELNLNLQKLSDNIKFLTDTQKKQMEVFTGIQAKIYEHETKIAVQEVKING